jgi:predicted  nucleic acid-binding Zn-ribbon protein
MNAADDNEVELKWHNFYQCPRCGTTWEDEWDCQCDDECPQCGNRSISPYHSEEIG